MNWKRFDNEISTKDLSKKNELIAGRVLRAKDGELALVGHTNENGGACDDCGYGGYWVEFCDDFVDVLKGQP